MIHWLTFALGCAIVAALSLIHPDNARWFALAFMGVLFVATAIPRRESKPGRRLAQPSRETEQ